MKRCMNKFGRQFRHGEKGAIDFGMLFALLSELLVSLLVLSSAMISMTSAAIPQITAWIGGGSGDEAAVELQMVRTAVTAYQDDNDGDLPTVVGFPCADEMDEYLSGGVAALEGTYTLDGTTGLVTQTSYPQENGGLLSILQMITG
jgi:hypothetical protein